MRHRPRRLPGRQGRRCDRGVRDQAGRTDPRGITAYVCIVEARLHIPESGSLKSKRKVVSSIKAQLRNRFGAAVSEVDGQDTWQRSTLVCALVGDGDVLALADELERYVRSRCADNCSFERDLLSLADIRG